MDFPRVMEVLRFIQSRVRPGEVYSWFLPLASLKHEQEYWANKWNFAGNLLEFYAGLDPDNKNLFMIAFVDMAHIYEQEKKAMTQGRKPKDDDAGSCVNGEAICRARLERQVMSDTLSTLSFDDVKSNMTEFQKIFPHCQSQEFVQAVNPDDYCEEEF